MTSRVDLSRALGDAQLRSGRASRRAVGPVESRSPGRGVLRAGAALAIATLPLYLASFRWTAFLLTALDATPEGYSAFTLALRPLSTAPTPTAATVNSWASGTSDVKLIAAADINATRSAQIFRQPSGVRSRPGDDRAGGDGPLARVLARGIVRYQTRRWLVELDRATFAGRLLHLWKRAHQ